MRYKYVGTTRKRETVRGELEAVDKVEAQMKLRSMQVRPLSIVPSRSLDFELGSLLDVSFGPPIDPKALMIFTKQFASLVDSGVAVVQCFEILSAQEKRKAFRKVLLKIKEDIEGGSSLAEALRRHKHVFSNLYVSLVEAGEVSGTLEVNLRRIGVQFEKTERIRSKVRSAMLYPTLTLVISVLVLIFLLVKVIPEVSRLYSFSKSALPDLTVKVLALSGWVQQNYQVLLGSFLAVGLGVFAVRKVSLLKHIFDPILLQLPVLGPILKKASISRLSRTLSTLISSGVPLLTAFEICTRLIENTAIRSVLKSTAGLVSEGKTIAHGFSQAPRIFPPMVIHMVSIGEVTGKLDDLMGKVADIYEEEVDDAVTNLTSLIQPVLIVLVGGIIAFLLLAMYLPIFQLAEKLTDSL